MEQEKNSFEQSYELQSEKIARLRNALVIETDPSRKFQYEQQIKNEETELKRLTDRLDEIEEQLQSAQSIPAISEPKSIQQKNMIINGQQKRKLQEALINAFPNTASLEQMLSFELDINLRAIAGEGSLQDIVFKLIQTAESHGWIEDLVRKALNSNPGNLKLKAINEELLTEGAVKKTPVSSDNLLIKLTQQQKILILTAIPHGLRLDKEIREIEEAIRRATNRDLFEIRIRTAVRPQDIRRAIAEEQPQIVHFCGHGLEDGSLLLEDDGGNDKPVTPSGLASLFKLHADYVKCVLLNACYSEKPAVAISKYINYAIGMNNPIQDSAAIEFARGFYDGLGYKNIGNQDVFQRAFDEGIVAIELESLSQESIPVLKKQFFEHNQDEDYSQLSPEEMVKRLTTKAKLRWSKISGDLRYIDHHIVDATNSVDIKLHDFILEAKFYNPYNGTDMKWKYGFSFRETSSDLNNPQRQVYTMWISSNDKILSLDGYGYRVEEEISNLNVLENSFNQVYLLVFRQTAIVYINNIYTQKFDIFDWMTPGKVYLVSAGYGEKLAKYETFKIWSISN
ncbi:effector-associated domain EAD1-containing protein [Nostoc linckia]|uniref:effector-associated domain EAD1-containing protein n=1 Tax=Nostoc linckia TaxID=92942 RepID=UPI001F552D76|nr:effector-associated domain EAD1-containing protein [Nostoc linckia]